MKKVIPVLAIVALTSCGDDKANRTQIPEELSQNEAVTEYFETLELAIDEYASMLEEVAETSHKSETSGKEPTISDAMEMLGGVTSSTLRMAPLLEKMERLEKRGDILKEDMTSEEIEAFMKTYTKIMLRFHELSEKQAFKN